MEILSASQFLDQKGLLQILTTPGRLPPALSDLSAGFEFTWSEDFPHQNVLSVNGKRATTIYVGEDVDNEQLNEVSKTIADFLRRSNHDRQRLAVWSRNPADEIVRFDLTRYLQYDRNDKASEFDITRAE
jgi:hypothetical protein